MPDSGKLQTFLAQTKELLQANKQDSALEQLGSYLQSIGSDEYDTIIMLKASYNGIMDDLVDGLLTDDQKDVKLNKLNSRIVLFTNRLPDKLSLEEYRPPQPTVDIPIAEPKVKAAFDNVKAEGDFEKIIGNMSNLKSISWLRKGLQASRSVGRIITPKEYGSGFLIKGDLLVTNNHVLPTAQVAAESTLEMNFEESLDRTMLPTTSYKLQPDDFFATDTELDYTIVKVNPQAQNNGGLPLAEWGSLSIDTAPAGVPAQDDRVIIIQHPNGGPKQIAVTNNQVVNIYADNYLQYTTDTLPGSSGSPVFNQHWKVVALHHKGGNLKTNKWGVKRFINQGVLFVAIQRALGTEVFL